MLISLGAVFGRMDGIRGAAVGRALLMVPVLGDDALVSADLGFRRATRGLVCRMHFAASAFTPEVRDRITFWLAREGGSVLTLASTENAARLADELARCDSSERAVSQADWSPRVRRILSTAGLEVPPEDPDQPVLALFIGGPGWEGLTYDPAARVLHVPSPLSPPPGDMFLLELDAPACRPFAYRGPTRVVASRARHEAEPGAPAGFALAIRSEREAAHSLLITSCPPPCDSSGSRAAQRYRVEGPVRVEEPEGTGEETVEYAAAEDLERDYVSNLSHGGAFIRTSRAYEVGAPLHLHLRLPNGEDLRVQATVVRTTQDGVGVRFTLDAHADAALSAAMTAMPGRGLRVLVIDDDVLARRMLIDAFAARGIECITAPDGTAGLHILSEELLSLDAVVTDIRMPGLSGEELIGVVRMAGGERDLPIVAVGGTVGDDLRARIVAAGADAVVLKEEGPERVVQIVEEAIVARAGVPVVAVEELAG